MGARVRVRPLSFNVVGALYVRLMKRFMRRRPGHPADIEAAFARGRHYRPKRAVTSLFGYYTLEFCLIFGGPAAALAALSRLSGSPVISQALWALGAITAAAPLGLCAGLGIWFLLPDSPPKSYFDNPERLRSASALAWMCWAAAALLTWSAVRS